MQCDEAYRSFFKLLYVQHTTEEYSSITNLTTEVRDSELSQSSQQFYYHVL